MYDNYEMTMNWVNWDDDDDDVDETKPKKVCYHVWEKTGTSPIFGNDWYNCKKCNMPKEEYDKDV